MKMTVLTSEGAEIFNVSDNSTLEDSVILTGSLTYAKCEMMTPYPMDNMSPQVNTDHSILMQSCHVQKCICQQT